jgi:predicted P-loop ATPase
VRTPYPYSDWVAGEPIPEGWDAADAIDDGWTKAEIDGFMRATVAPWVPPEKPSQMAQDGRSAPAGATIQPERPAPAGGPVAQLRSTQQEQPATVTDIRTRTTVAADDSWMLQLVTNAEGKTKPGVTKNWALFLENHPETEGVFAYDAFKLRVMVMEPPPWEKNAASFVPRTLQDRDYSEAVMWLEARYMTPKVSNIAAVIQTIAEHRSFDRLTEYLNGLEWDGKARVADFASRYLGCDSGNYSPVVSEKWLSPGCKVDTMPILEGPQGAQKSTALRVLYGDEFFTDELSDIGSKDAKMEMQGVWGLEVGEMHRFGAAETSAVKKFLSSQSDRFRPPYGRSIIEAPRRVVLLGTINPEGNAYLKDPTGARRFWPLTVGRIDVAAIARDRDQLWAEAVAMFKGGRNWWLDEEQVVDASAEQDKRTDVDVWVDLIVPMLVGKRTISQLDIFQEIGIPKKDADWRHAGRVGRIMKKLGWSSYRDRSAGEDRVVFQAPEGHPGQERIEW